MNSIEIARLNSELQSSHPKDILAAIFEAIPRCALSFSGAEDVALIDMASKLMDVVPVFSLDTGRLHPETYQLMQRVRDSYAIDHEVFLPDTAALQAFVTKKGLYSFYEDGHGECCSIRKVDPLKRKLATVDAWVTGQRRDQSPSRSEVAVIQLDEAFSSEAHPVVKVNPLANWSSSQVWEYIRMFDVPFNDLHDRGYLSIGCEPCTKPVGPNQHEREGRWWWEEATIKECGLHRPAGSEGDSD